MKRVEVINQLRLHIEEAQSLRQEARKAVAQAKVDTHNNVPIVEMHIVAIVDFYQNIQLPSHTKDQPGDIYFFVPLNIYILGVVDCNSEKSHLHAYIYTEAEAEVDKGANTVASLIMKYLLDPGLFDGRKQYKLTIIMDNCMGQNKNNYIIHLAAYLTMKNYFEIVCIMFLVTWYTKNTAD